jgi:hypothetical protein
VMNTTMNKKLLPVAGLLTLLTASQCFARIGETFRECEKRYGKCQKRTPEMSIFEKNGISIGIRYYENKADFILYRKSEETAAHVPIPFSDTEIEILLNSNSGEKKWKAGDVTSTARDWVTEDGALLARYTLMDNSLTIITKVYKDRFEAEEKIKQQKNLKGF